MFMKRLWCLLFVIEFGSCLDPSLVSYYDSLIKSELEKARYYKFNRDASRYRARSPLVNKDFGEFDFIIVGAGAAGSVIANRLSEISDWNILLLEAGGYENNFTDIPAMTTISTLSDYNWGFMSVPQKSACLAMENHVCPYPRGRALGGTTVINGLAYSRGLSQGYNKLSEDGNPGWSYQELLPYFLKSENLRVTDANAVVDYDHHYVGGPLDVTYHIPPSRELPNFLQANIEIGVNITDTNGPGSVGVGRAQMNIINGKRFSGYRAFIKPVEKQKNLKIMTHSYVTKLLINNQKIATGVQFTYKGRLHEATAKLEVILSAGTISSPQILMLSGIGPAEHLKKLNIPVVENLEVGSNLVDHLGLSLFYNSNYPQERHSMEEYVKQFLVGIGGLSAPGPNDAFGFYQTRVEKRPNYPDLEIILAPNYGNITDDFSQNTMNLRAENIAGYIPSNANTRSFRIDLFELHTTSRGTIRLKSNNPYDYPLIDPNCLSDAEGKDIETVYEGIQMVSKLMDAPSMRAINASLLPITIPACQQYDSGSKDYWYCIIRQLGHPVHHPFGTCSMGPSPSAGHVVDHNLKVYGIGNLRVADASIFPFALTGHPNAPCVMVGEKISDVIKAHYNKL